MTEERWVLHWWEIDFSDSGVIGRLYDEYEKRLIEQVLKELHPMKQFGFQKVLKYDLVETEEGESR